MKNFFIIIYKVFLLLVFLEIFFKGIDFFDRDYFDKKKNIISYYTDYKNDPFIGYTARKNSSGKQIHYTSDTYFETTTNSNGFRTHELYPKIKNKFRVIILGDSVVFGMNANDNETLSVQLENIYKNKISENIEVLSLGIIGYSTLNHLGIARNYFEFLNPDLIILCIDRTDFHQDKINLKKLNYDFDTEGYPYSINTFDHGRVTKDIINKIKLESSLFSRINYLRHKLKKYRLDRYFQKISQKKINTIIYDDLDDLEKKNFYKIIDHEDIIKYDLEKSKLEYTETFNALEYINKKSKQINSKMYLSTYPYAWNVNPNYSLFYQVNEFGTKIDFTNNTIYPDLVNYYAKKLNIQNLDSYSFFKNSDEKLWGDFDPHFNTDGYKLYADYLFLNTKDFINNKLKK